MPFVKLKDFLQPYYGIFFAKLGNVFTSHCFEGVHGF